MLNKVRLAKVKNTGDREIFTATGNSHCKLQSAVSLKHKIEWSTTRLSTKSMCSATDKWLLSCEPRRTCITAQARCCISDTSSYSNTEDMNCGHLERSFVPDKSGSSTQRGFFNTQRRKRWINKRAEVSHAVCQGSVAGTQQQRERSSHVWQLCGASRL